MNFKSQIIKKIKEQKEKSIYESVMETEGNWAVLKSFGFFFFFFQASKSEDKEKSKAGEGDAENIELCFLALALI